MAVRNGIKKKKRRSTQCANATKIVAGIGKIYHLCTLGGTILGSWRKQAGVSEGRGRVLAIAVTWGAYINGSYKRFLN